MSSVATSIPLYTRYYQFKLIYDSVKGNKAEMQQNYQKNLLLHELANGPQSIFNLEALLTEISVKADIEDDAERSILESIGKMKQICEQSNYITQAEVMLALIVS